jgi:hypothetical protein
MPGQCFPPLVANYSCPNDFMCLLCHAACLFWQVWSTIHVLIHNCKDPMAAAQVEASRALAVWLRQVRWSKPQVPGITTRCCLSGLPA